MRQIPPPTSVWWDRTGLPRFFRRSHRRRLPPFAWLKREWIDGWDEHTRHEIPHPTPPHPNQKHDDSHSVVAARGEVPTLLLLFLPTSTTSTKGLQARDARPVAPRVAPHRHGAGRVEAPEVPHAEGAVVPAREEELPAHVASKGGRPDLWGVWGDSFDVDCVGVCRSRGCEWERRDVNCDDSALAENRTKHQTNRKPDLDRRPVEAVGVPLDLCCVVLCWCLVGVWLSMNER